MLRDKVRGSDNHTCANVTNYPRKIGRLLQNTLSRMLSHQILGVRGMRGIASAQNRAPNAALARRTGRK